VAGNNKVILNWDEPVDSVATAFVVAVTPDERLVRVTAPADGVTVSGLRNGVEYTFGVYSVSDDGSSDRSVRVRSTPANGAEGEIAGLIVGFEPATVVMDGQESVPGESLVDEVGLTVNSGIAPGMHTVDFSEPVTLVQATAIAAELAADPRVAWAEPDQFVFTSAIDASAAPSDPRFLADQWNLWDTYGVGLGDGAGRMSPFFSVAGRSGATVAVIDTGITAHPDLDSNIAPGFDFVSDPPGLAAPRVEAGPDVSFDGDGQAGWDADPTDPGDWRGVAPVRDSSWHGTHVAGVIAAQSNNGLGVVGITPGARIQPIRALSWRGGLLSDIAASITWASGGHVDGVADNATPASVINMSFAMSSTCSVALQTAISDAVRRGSVLVAAAGNANADVKDYAPANCVDVISVGATDRDGMRAPYSNFGSGIDIAAPGGSGAGASGVLSTSNTGLTSSVTAGYGAKEGTSIAAAHVSAAAAWLSVNAPAADGQTPEQKARAIAQRLTGRSAMRDFAGGQCDADASKTCGPGILYLAQIASASEPGVSMNAIVGGSAIADGSTVATGSTMTLGTSGLLSPGSGSRTLRTTLHPGTVYRTGTAVAPEGWTINYSANGGSTWNSSEPSPVSGVTDVRATATASAGLIDGTSQIYSSETTSSVPSSSFSASTGGDGWDVFFSDDNVFNIFHHANSLQLDCHLIATGARCDGGYPATFANYTASGHASGWVDQISGNVFVMTTYTTSRRVGALCITVTSTPTSCGFTTLSDVQAGTDYRYTSEPTWIGRKLFAFDSYIKQVVCFDASTVARCASSPVSVSDIVDTIDPQGYARSSYNRILSAGTRIMLKTPTRMHCFTTTMVECTGFPVTIAAGSALPIAQHATSSGDADGVCFKAESGIGSATAAASSCLDFSGAFRAEWTSPFNKYAGGTDRPWWLDGTQTLGRFYWAQESVTKIGCYDWATNAWCAGFHPLVFAGGLNYAMRVDPTNPQCLWFNSDAGLIRNFDALTGTLGCTANPVITLQPSQFAPRYACSTTSGITEWSQLRLVSLGGGGSASAVTLTVRDALGAVVTGWLNRAVPVSPGSNPLGTLDMTGLDTALSGSRPTFSFAFSGLTGTVSTAVIALDYKGKGPELCVSTTATAASPPVNVTVTGTLIETVGVSETFSTARSFIIGGSASIIELTVPGAPTALSGSGLNSTATVTFRPPVSDGGSTISGYSISTNGGTSYADATIVDRGDGTLSATVTGLTPGSTYAVRLAANNAVGRGTAAAVSITSQLLAIETLVDTPLNEGPMTLMASTSGGLPLTYTSSTPSICTAGGTGGRTIALVAIGTCNLVAHQAGDASATPIILPAEANGSFRVVAAYYAPTTATVPLGLLLAPGSGQVRLTWNAPASDGHTPVTDYSVQYKASSSGSWIPFLDGVTGATYALIPGLANGSSYDFRVAAVNSVGTGSYTTTATAIPATIPGAPTSLSATGSGTSRTLTWTAPASTGGSPITDYVVAFKLSSSSIWTTFSDGTSASTGATVTGLTSGGVYDYQVTTVNAVGVSGATSTVNLTPTPGNSQVVLAWSVPSSPGGTITDYVIQYRNSESDPWSTFTDSISTSTGGTVTGLANGTASMFRVATMIGPGTVSSYTSVVTSTPRTLPSAPTVTATPGNRQVALSWVTPADGGSAITDYVVQFKAHADSSWSTFADGTSASPNVIVTGLLNGTSYDFRVSSTNVVGTSSVSSTVASTPRTTPGVPGSASAIAGDGSVALSWSSPASTGGSAITDYLVEYKTSSAFTWTTWTHSPATAVTATISGLTNGVAHEFRVAAVNGSGSGGYSTILAATPRGVPSVPTAFVVTNGDGQVDLAWSAPLTVGGYAISDYAIEFKLSSASTWTTIVDGIGTGTTYRHTGLTSGLTYNYRVFAVNSVGSGAVALASGAPAAPLAAGGSAGSSTSAPTSSPSSSPASPGLQSTPLGPLPMPPILSAVGAGVIDGGPMEIRITFLGTGNDTTGASAWQAAGDDFSIRFTPQGSANSATPAGQAQGLRVPAGGWIDVSGDGYADKSQVRIHLIPRTAVRSRAWSPDPITPVAEAEVANGGTFTVRVEVPREAVIGDYALQVNGMSVGNKVRSINMSLAVTDPSSASAGSKPTWTTQSKKAFFAGGSERFTVVGQSKLRSLAEFMPLNAMRVRVRVHAVSVGLNDLEENLMLAAKRGRRILVYLKSLGVKGSYTIIVQEQDVTAGSQPAVPGRAGDGKPLTRVSVTYAVPAGSKRAL
jgi:titin